jgi:hypothetical protein
MLNLEIELDHGPIRLRSVKYHIVSGVETVLTGRDILKTLGLDPLILLESRQATGEIKEIEFPYMSPGPDTAENAGKFDLDDDVPIAEELLDTELCTALNEMIARAAKGLEKDQTEELRSLVFRFKDIWRVALTNDGPATV